MVKDNSEFGFPKILNCGFPRIVYYQHYLLIRNQDQFDKIDINNSKISSGDL